MTALGLFTAIPAVLAYNFFARLNRVTNNKFDTFAHDLHRLLRHRRPRRREVPVKR